MLSYFCENTCVSFRQEFSTSYCFIFVLSITNSSWLKKEEKLLHFLASVLGHTRSLFEQSGPHHFFTCYHFLINCNMPTNGATVFLVYTGNLLFRIFVNRLLCFSDGVGKAQNLLK